MAVTCKVLLAVHNPGKLEDGHCLPLAFQEPQDCFCGLRAAWNASPDLTLLFAGLGLTEVESGGLWVVTAHFKEERIKPNENNFDHLIGSVSTMKITFDIANSESFQRWDWI